MERFYNGRAEGIFKTFSLRGIKDSPPYLHDGRLLTLEDTVEFFNVVLGTKLSAAEKRDVVSYAYCEEAHGSSDSFRPALRPLR